MSGKRKLETTVSAVHEEKKPKDSQSIIDDSSGATSTKTMTTPTSVIQNSPQTLLNTTNRLPGTQQPKKIKATTITATPLQPGQPIPSGTSVFMSGGKTYCIPKSMLAKHKLQLQQQQQTSIPTLPVTPLPPPGITNVLIASNIGGKNLKYQVWEGFFGSVKHYQFVRKKIKNLNFQQIFGYRFAYLRPM